jgi:hypothetical protein
MTSSRAAALSINLQHLSPCLTFCTPPPPTYAPPPRRQGAAVEYEHYAHVFKHVTNSCAAGPNHCTPSPTGKELESDHDTVQSSGLRNRACLIVAERVQVNDFTRSPSEYRPFYELYSYTWIVAQAVSDADRCLCEEQP